MALVDDQGRLFGRLNLLDAVLLILLLGLIPLGYGAWALFRTPAPVLTAVEPAELQTGSRLRVTIRGEHLRPYMRVSFNTLQGRTFLFEDSTSAQVELGDIPPGTYDVVLYDHAQERQRLRQALTILPVPLPNTEVIVVGSFGNLTEETAARLSEGLEIPDVGSVVALGRPLPESTRVYAGSFIVEIPGEGGVRLPAAVRMRCQIQTPGGHPVCGAADVSLQPTAVILVPTPVGTLPFQVDQLRSVLPLETLRVDVRLAGPASVLAQVVAGDVDHGQFINELAAGARVVDVRPVRMVSDQQAVREVTVLVDGQRGSSSWTYASGPLRVGGPFEMRTFQYQVEGTVLAVSTDASTPGGARSR
jgi:hypothetical protein